jgi:hypothetical protein
MGDVSHDELAAFDDLAGDLVLDSMLGVRTHKMAARYRSGRVPRAELAALIQRALASIHEAAGQPERASEAAPASTAAPGLVAQSAGEAVGDAVERCIDAIFQLEWAEGSRARGLLASRKFREHVRRYLRVFLPCSGFTIRPSERYPSSAYQDVRVVATRAWRKGRASGSTPSPAGSPPFRRTRRRSLSARARTT